MRSIELFPRGEITPSISIETVRAKPLIREQREIVMRRCLQAIPVFRDGLAQDICSGMGAHSATTKWFEIWEELCAVSLQVLIALVWRFSHV